MIRAVIQSGAIVPLEPLPADWEDGQEVCVDANGNRSAPHEPDSDEEGWRKLEELCAEGSDEDWQRMQDAIDRHHRQAKEYARRKTGL
jgi:hypothetical protein